MKAVTPGPPMMVTLLMVVVACLTHGSTALPPVQTLPSPERPFVFIHVMKTGGTSLREFIRAGALEAGVPQEQIYIPCYDGLSCYTSTIPTKPLSVIAGHFSWAELERGGVKQLDCMVSIRDPIDIATSCLFYFYGDAMGDVSMMTEEDFRNVVLNETSCNNAAAFMLTSGLPGVDVMTVNRASLNASLSEAISASALSNLESCVVIDHLDVSQGQIWATWAPMFLTTWFPWVSKGSTGIPHSNASGKPYRLPFRLVKVLEDLNSVDRLLYSRATELMLLQLGSARAREVHTRQEAGAHTQTAPSKPAAET